MASKDFHIGDLISVYWDRLVSPRKIDGLYDLLGWMTGDNLMTHQLPSAARIAKPYLEDQHPWLKTVIIPASLSGWDEVNAFLEDVAGAFGETHAVEPMPAKAWGVHDPIADLRAMRPDMPILAVSVPR